MNKPSINLEILEEKLGQWDWEKWDKAAQGISIEQILETDIYLGVLGVIDRQIILRDGEILYIYNSDLARGQIKTESSGIDLDQLHKDGLKKLALIEFDNWIYKEVYSHPGAFHVYLGEFEGRQYYYNRRRDNGEIISIIGKENEFLPLVGNFAKRMEVKKVFAPVSEEIKSEALEALENWNGKACSDVPPEGSAVYLGTYDKVFNYYYSVEKRCIYYYNEYECNLKIDLPIDVNLVSMKRKDYEATSFLKASLSKESVSIKVGEFEGWSTDRMLHINDLKSGDIYLGELIEKQKRQLILRQDGKVYYIMNSDYAPNRLNEVPFFGDLTSIYWESRKKRALEGFAVWSGKVEERDGLIWDIYLGRMKGEDYGYGKYGVFKYKKLVNGVGLIDNFEDEMLKKMDLGAKIQEMRGEPVTYYYANDKLPNHIGLGKVMDGICVYNYGWDLGKGEIFETSQDLDCGYQADIDKRIEKIRRSILSWEGKLERLLKGSVVGILSDGRRLVWDGDYLGYTDDGTFPVEHLMFNLEIAKMEKLFKERDELKEGVTGLLGEFDGWSRLAGIRLSEVISSDIFLGRLDVAGNDRQIILREGKLVYLLWSNEKGKMLEGGGLYGDLNLMYHKGKEARKKLAEKVFSEYVYGTVNHVVDLPSDYLYLGYHSVSGKRLGYDLVKKLFFIGDCEGCPLVDDYENLLNKKRDEFWAWNLDLGNEIISSNSGEVILGYYNKLGAKYLVSGNLAEAKIFVNWTKTEEKAGICQSLVDNWVARQEFDEWDGDPNYLYVDEVPGRYVYLGDNGSLPYGYDLESGKLFYTDKFNKLSGEELVGDEVRERRQRYQLKMAVERLEKDKLVNDEDKFNFKVRKNVENWGGNWINFGEVTWGLLKIGNIIWGLNINGELRCTHRVDNVDFWSDALLIGEFEKKWYKRFAGWALVNLEIWDGDMEKVKESGVEICIGVIGEYSVGFTFDGCLVKCKGNIGVNGNVGGEIYSTWLAKKDKFLNLEESQMESVKDKDKVKVSREQVEKIQKEVEKVEEKDKEIEKLERRDLEEKDESYYQNQLENLKEWNLSSMEERFDGTLVEILPSEVRYYVTDYYFDDKPSNIVISNDFKIGICNMEEAYFSNRLSDNLGDLIYNKIKERYKKSRSMDLSSEAISATYRVAAEQVQRSIGKVVGEGLPLSVMSWVLGNYFRSSANEHLVKLSSEFRVSALASMGNSFFEELFVEVEKARFETLEEEELETEMEEKELVNYV